MDTDSGLFDDASSASFGAGVAELLVYGLDYRCSIPGREWEREGGRGSFVFLTASRPTVEPTHPPV